MFCLAKGSVSLSEIEILPSPQPSILLPSTVMHKEGKECQQEEKNICLTAETWNLLSGIWKTASLVEVNKIMILKLAE